MPVSNHLQWAEFNDFNQGVTDRYDWLMQGTGNQQMTDVQPVPTGGLRAFFKPYYLTTNGLTSTDRVIAIHAFMGTGGPRYFLAMERPSTRVVRLYGIDLALGESSWTLLKTFAAWNSSSPASAGDAARGNFCTYTLTAVIFGFGGNSADQGVWRIDMTNPGAGNWSVSRISSVYGPPVTSFQQRLIACFANTFAWSNPGGFNINSSGEGGEISLHTGDYDVQQAIAALAPHQPSDMVIATWADGFYLVQGDFTDPEVRQMSQAHNLGIAQTLGRSPDGEVFFEPGGGIYVTQSGADFRRLNDLQSPISYGHHRGFAYRNGYLFAPDGRVMDYRGGGWFTLSEAATVLQWQEQQFQFPLTGGSPPVPHVGGTIWGVNYADNFKIVHYPLREAPLDVPASGGVWSGDPITAGEVRRYHTYTWKSAPFRYPSGHQAEIREVQIVLKAYANNSSVTCTVNGTPRTISSIAAGRQYINVLFKERNEVLDLTVTPSGPVADTTIEAPSIEAIRIGFQQGHRLY